MKTLICFIGGFISTFFLIYLSQHIHTPLIMAPFGATCVLLYAVPQSPLAQPKNIILGHFISASVGIITLYTLDSSPLTMAIAVGISIASMNLLNCVHPPAGANPLVILLATTHIDFSFLIFPVLTGSIILVMIAKIINLSLDLSKFKTHLKR